MSTGEEHDLANMVPVVPGQTEESCGDKNLTLGSPLIPTCGIMLSTNKVPVVALTAASTGWDHYPLFQCLDQSGMPESEEVHKGFGCKAEECGMPQQQQVYAILLDHYQSRGVGEEDHFQPGGEAAVTKVQGYQ